MTADPRGSVPSSERHSPPGSAAPKAPCRVCDGHGFMHRLGCPYGGTTTEPTKPPRDEHDQPLPKQNSHPVVQELVLTDLRERLAVGIQRYGTGLQPHNGRDMLRDAYDEAMDLVVYLRGCLYERDAQ